MLLFAWADYSPARYGDYKFPRWADAMGWLMTLCSVIWIPIWAGYLVKRQTGSWKQVRPREAANWLVETGKTS